MSDSLQSLAQQRNNSPLMMSKPLKILFVLLCCCPIVALADDAEPDKWGFNLGAFLTSQKMDTKFEASAPGGDAGSVNFESDLGFSNSLDVFRFGGFYQFGENERHRLDFSAFDLSQVSTKTLETEFEWQDIIYPISADVVTNLDLAIYKAAYTYKFLNEDNAYLGVTGGFYVADIGIGIKFVTSGLGEAASITAPLPVLGFRGEYHLSERWRLHGSVEWLLIDVDNYHGTLQDVMFGLDYRLFDHAAIGIGHNTMQMDLDATQKALRAELRWNYSGAIAYLQFSF
jgi:hypothetical protein